MSAQRLSLFKRKYDIIDKAGYVAKAHHKWQRLMTSDGFFMSLQHKINQPLTNFIKYRIRLNKYSTLK